MQKDINKDKVTIETQARFENVATALYLVTSHLSETEPLKNRVRIVTHNVLEEFMSINDVSTQVIFDHLSHIRSLLKIASVSGMISAQNVSLIDSEIIAIQSMIKDLQSAASSLSVSIGKVLMLDFVGQPYPEHFDQTSRYQNQNAATDIQGQAITNSVNSSNKSQENKNSIQVFNYRNQNEVSAQSVLQNRPQATAPKQVNLQQSAAAPKNTQSQTPKVEVPKPQKQNISTGMTERQTTIVREIKNKGQLTIRDLVGKIEGISEKTIQRELLSLVESGVLQKEGERRWSKYSVK